MLEMRWSFESEQAAGAIHARADLVAYLLAHADGNSDLQAAELIFGELIGNVVRHAPGPISVDLEWRDGVAVLSVRDFGPGFDWTGARKPEPLAESGRGLFIVQTLARAVDIARDSQAGMQVTAWLPVSLRAAVDLAG
jgi:anti-sigma regulatory factor (Ser/Thr protein kinase)